jgi:hypothetical protein
MARTSGMKIRRPSAIAEAASVIRPPISADQ